MTGSSNQRMPSSPKALRGAGRGRAVEAVVGVDHEAAVRAEKVLHRAGAGHVVGKLGAPDLDLHAVEAALEVALDAGDQLLQREGEVDAAAIGAGRVRRSAGHAPERLARAPAPDVPEGDVDGRIGEARDAAAADIVGVPVHRLGHRLDRAAVAAQQERREVVLDHRPYGVAAATAGVGVAGALRAVGQPDGGGDQLEVAVVAVLRVDKHLVERHLVEARLDRGDGVARLRHAGRR